MGFSKCHRCFHTYGVGTDLLLLRSLLVHVAYLDWYGQQGGIAHAAKAPQPPTPRRTIIIRYFLITVYYHSNLQQNLLALPPVCAAHIGSAGLATISAGSTQPPCMAKNIDLQK